MLGQRLLGLSKRQEGGFPAFFQFAGDEPIVRVGAIELALRESCLVAQPFNLLLLGLPQGALSD